MRRDRVDLLQEMMAVREMDPEDGRWFSPISQALAGLTAAQAAWVAGDGMNTIWQLVNHLTFWTQFVTGRLAGGHPWGERIDNNATFGDPGDASDEDGWARAVQGLRDAYSELAAALSKQTDLDMERPLNSQRTPAATMVSGSVMHDAYHIGQIVLLRRMQGSWRVLQL